MFRIQFVLLFQSEYPERSLCGHDPDLRSPLPRPYQTEIADPVGMPL